ncbi:MAG: JAB domain-containing protein [Solidesulfovibrio sp.]
MPRTPTQQIDSSRKPRKPAKALKEDLRAKYSYLCLTPANTINRPESIFAYLTDVMDVQQEMTIIFFIGKKLEYKGREVVSLGQSFPFFLSPDALLKPALVQGAKRIIVAHNHLSGGPAPTPVEIETAKFVYEACKDCRLELLDHVIFSDKGFFSFLDEGLLYRGKEGGTQSVRIEPATEAMQ